jgi:hypothetical protein
LQHPFITGQSFDPSFIPIPDLASDTSKSAIPQYVNYFSLKIIEIWPRILPFKN